MEVIWEAFIEFLQGLLFVLAQSYGGELGPAILTLSLGLRVALLPISYRSAVRALKHRRVLAGIRPQLDRLRETHKENPAKLAEATLALHKKHGVSVMDPGLLIAGVIQAPLALGVLGVLRRVLNSGVSGFLWIKDLSRPDIFVAGIAAGLIGLAGAISGGTSESNLPTTTLLVLPVMTLMFAMRMSAGFGLHMAVSGGVALLQSLALRIRHGRDP